MNDHNLSVYVLPVNTDSDWRYLYIAEDAKNLQNLIARRPIREPAYMTVYTNSGEWLTVGSTEGGRFEATKLNTHMISDEKATLIWKNAKAIYDEHVNFSSDLRRVQKALFPKVRRNTPCYLNLVT